jgi:hypothetical protein
VIGLKITTSGRLKPWLEKRAKLIKPLPRQAYDFFNFGKGIIDVKGFKGTPIKTGAARRNTRLRKNTIEANYAYAEVLDKGRHMTNRGMRGSVQAMIGMTRPTIQYMRLLFRRILRSGR